MLLIPKMCIFAVENVVFYNLKCSFVLKKCNQNRHLPSVYFLGMPLVEIIRASTITPAKAYRLSDQIGSLATGMEADVTILRLEKCNVMMEDCQAQIRNLKQRLVAVAVWRAGTRYPVTCSTPWPNIESRKKVISEWYDSLIVKDEQEPTIDE